MRRRALRYQEICPPRGHAGRADEVPHAAGDKIGAEPHLQQERTKFFSFFSIQLWLVGISYILLSQEAQ